MFSVACFPSGAGRPGFRSLAVSAALYFRKSVCDTCPFRASCRGAFATHNLLYGKIET